MKAFSKFIVGPSFGVATWAGTAFIPVVGPWSPVLGLAVAFVLCACPFPSWAAIGRLRPRSPVRRGSFVSVDVPALYEEGLGIRSVAEELGRSYSTARREWGAARAARPEDSEFAPHLGTLRHAAQALDEQATRALRAYAMRSPYGSTFQCAQGPTWLRIRACNDAARIWDRHPERPRQNPRWPVGGCSRPGAAHRPRRSGARRGRGPDPPTPHAQG